MVLKDNVIISSGLQARWHLRKMIPDSLICLTAPIASLIIYRLRGSQFIFTEQILLCWDLLGPNIQLPNWHPHRNVPKASSRSAHSIFKNHDIDIPSLCYAFPCICVFGNKISIQPEKCGVFYAASWFLVRFVSTASWWELLQINFKNNFLFTQTLQSSHIPPHPVSPVLSNLHQYRSFVTINETIWIYFY